MTSETPSTRVAESQPDDLPVLPNELADAWQKIEQSNLGCRMKKALRLVATGESIRAAAEIVGYAGHADVYRSAKRYGLIDTRTLKLIERHRRISNLSGEEIERRLVDDPEKISTQQLGILQGISTDKVLASEKASIPDSRGYLSALDRLAEKLAEGGGLELTVSIKSTASDSDAIDVTPSSDATDGES